MQEGEGLDVTTISREGVQAKKQLPTIFKKGGKICKRYGENSTLSQREEAGDLGNATGNSREETTAENTS